MAESTTHASRRLRGVTLVELLVGLAIAALLMGMGVPQFAGFIAEQRLANDARRLADSLVRARSEAVRRNQRVDVCAAIAGRCASGAGWSQGWLTFVDPDASGEPAGTASVIGAEPPVRPAISVVANRPVARYVSFTFDGHARQLDGALQMGTFSVCERGHNAIKVVLAHSGRVRIERGAEPCR